MATACSTTTSFAAPREMGEADVPRIYRLRKSFAVVVFEATGRGRIAFLPEGAELRMAGPSAISKCVEVLCGNQRYHIFQQDLLGPWSIPVSSSRRGMVRVKAVRICA